MADYRQFCDECQNEVGFGQHKPDCQAPARADEYRRQHEIKQQQRLDEKKWRLTHAIEVYELMLTLKDKLDPEQWALIARYYELEI